MMVFGKRNFNKLLSAFLAVGLMITPIAQVPVYAAQASLELHMIDVGQGDAIFIQYQNFDILIDAGENNMGSRVVDYISPKLKGNLDLVIATHPDSDHIGGLDTVLSQFKVNKIIDSGMTHTSVTYKDYMREVNAQVQKGATYLEDSDMTIPVGPNASLEIIETGDDNGSKNNNSVVAKLQIGKVSCLLTGDMEAEVEHKVLDRNLKSDIIKVGHHGSRSSSSSDFIAKVEPQAALISAGYNSKYGHPHPETVGLLNQLNIPYFLTSVVGHVVMTTNGTTFDLGGKTFTGHSDGTTGGTNPGGEEPGGGETPNPGGGETPNPGTGAAKIVIDSLDVKAESVTLKNTGNTTADLAGWTLLSTVGNQKFVFAEGQKLEPGKSLVIVSGKAYNMTGNNVLQWTKSNVWSDSYDPAELYNEKDEKIAEWGKE